MTRQLMPNARPAITGISGPDSEPMAFTNCARERFREYFPSPETSRMSGLPATCSIVAPAPSSSIVSRNAGKAEKPATVGMSNPTNMTHSPSMSTCLLPLRFWYKFIGTERIPNMMKPVKAISWAPKFERWKSWRARLTKGPTASPKPMTRNARKTGAARQSAGLEAAAMETLENDGSGIGSSGGGLFPQLEKRFPKFAPQQGALYTPVAGALGGDGTRFSSASPRG